MRLIFIGGGRFTAELCGWMKTSGHLNDFNEICYLSPERSKLELKYLGDFSTSYLKPTDKLILSIGDISYRKEAISRLSGAYQSFINYFHPSCIINTEVSLGIGTVMLPYSLVSTHAKVGDFSLLNVYASIGHDCSIGDNLVMSPYSAITGNCILGDNVFMGTHSSIIPGRKVGNDVKLSVGTVALRHIPDGHTLIGSVTKTVKL